MVLGRYLIFDICVNGLLGLLLRGGGGHQGSLRLGSQATFSVDHPVWPQASSELAQ